MQPITAISITMQPNTAISIGVGFRLLLISGKWIFFVEITQKNGNNSAFSHLHVWSLCIVILIRNTWQDRFFY